MICGYTLEDVSSGIDETAERQPLGVFAAITPFNFPMMVPMWFLPTAITCGNTYIIKPSPQTPISMQLVYELLDELGLPEGVVNLVHGGKEASMAVMEHPDIVGVSFVGSSPVAKLVYETCAEAGKRVQAQGGAKNYIVVMPDADMGASVANIMGSAYGCAGQRCLAGWWWWRSVRLTQFAAQRTRAPRVGSARRLRSGRNHADGHSYFPASPRTHRKDDHAGCGRGREAGTRWPQREGRRL